MSLGRDICGRTIPKGRLTRLSSSIGPRLSSVCGIFRCEVRSFQSPFETVQQSWKDAGRKLKAGERLSKSACRFACCFDSGRELEKMLRAVF